MANWSASCIHLVQFVYSEASFSMKHPLHKMVNSQAGKGDNANIIC